ncbi:MAG: carbohydrate kinase family protein [Patescibacteria group bacterium]|nr:carbohydrate kinase family protein [Patescibacteria group bacterium]
MVEGFGLTQVDILLNVPQKIVLNQKHIVSEQIFQIGGVIPTSLIFLARLGVDCQLHTTLADDNFGKMITQWLKSEKVKLDPIRTKTEASPSAVVIVEQPTGNRSGFYNLGGITDLSDNDLNQVNFRPKSKFLLLGRHNPGFIQALMRQAKRQGLTTLLDLGSYQKVAVNLAKTADVVFVSSQGRDEALKLHQSGPKICVVTQGEKGSFIANQGKVFHQPAFRVKAVDTNGAGDVFMGGFAFGLIQGWPLKKTAQFASAAAALTCTKFGKIQSMPKSEAEVLNLIRGH